MRKHFCVFVLFRGMTRWGEFDNLNHIDELEESAQEGSETVDSAGG